MADTTLNLLQHALKKKGLPSAMAQPALVELCGIIDMFNQQHWHDRDRYGEEIRKLRAEVTDLRRKLTAKESA